MKIFVDEDIEERYAQGLYEDYLKEQIEQKDKEIERLNKGLEYIELYWSNREEYEKNELLRQIRDKDTSIEWLERAIEEEKKRERLH